MEYAEPKPTIPDHEESPYETIQSPNVYSYVMINAPVKVSLPDGTHLSPAETHSDTDRPRSQGSDREGISAERDDQASLYTTDFKASPEAKIGDSMVDNKGYGTLQYTKLGLINNHEEENPYATIQSSNVYSYAMHTPVKVGLPDGTHSTPAETHSNIDRFRSQGSGISAEINDWYTTDFKASPEANIGDSMVDNKGYGTLQYTNEPGLVSNPIYYTTSTV